MKVLMGEKILTSEYNWVTQNWGLSDETSFRLYRLFDLNITRETILKQVVLTTLEWKELGKWLLINDGKTEIILDKDWSFYKEADDITLKAIIDDWKKMFQKVEINKSEYA